MTIPADPIHIMIATTLIVGTIILMGVFFHNTYRVYHRNDLQEILTEQNKILISAISAMLEEKNKGCCGDKKCKDKKKEKAPDKSACTSRKRTKKNDGFVVPAGHTLIKGNPRLVD